MQRARCSLPRFGGAGINPSSSAARIPRWALLVCLPLCVMGLVLFPTSQTGAVIDDVGVDPLGVARGGAGFDDEDEQRVASHDPKSPAAKRNKCLVVVSFHDCNRSMRAPEWTNVPHFLTHGYIPHGTPTIMFPGGVEYLFVTNAASLGPEALKMSKAAGNSNVFHDIPNVPNARIAVTPKAASDLSMIQLLYHDIMRDYGGTVSRYVVLNTGTRGPLISPEYLAKDGSGAFVDRSSPNGTAAPYYWVDAAGGARLLEYVRANGMGEAAISDAREALHRGAFRPQSASPNGTAPPSTPLARVDRDAVPYENLVVGSLINRNVALHVQSYFVSLPPLGFDVYFSKFLSKNKWNVILEVEVGAPQRLGKMGFSIYATGQGMTWQTAGAKLPRRNPALNISCAKCCFFAKHNLMIDPLQRVGFVDDLDTLTVAMRSVFNTTISVNTPPSTSTEPHINDMGADARIVVISANHMARLEALRRIEAALRRFWCPNLSLEHYEGRAERMARSG